MAPLERLGSALLRGCRSELGNSIDAQIFPCYPKIARAAGKLRSAGAAAAVGACGVGSGRVWLRLALHQPP